MSRVMWSNSRVLSTLIFLCFQIEYSQYTLEAQMADIKDAVISVDSMCLCNLHGPFMLQFLEKLRLLKQGQVLIFHSVNGYMNAQQHSLNYCSGFWLTHGPAHTCLPNVQCFMRKQHLRRVVKG